VNFYPCARRLLVLCAFIPSMAAAAGTMGATSRATVSISIVIPPHIVVAQAKPPVDGSSSNGQPGLCVATNGLRRYHLTLVTGSGVIDDGQILPFSAGAACPSSNSAADDVGAAYIAPVGRSSHEPPMLFIVPD